MNETQLFEVGLAERYDSGYYVKRYVIANDDIEARGKMRRKILLEEEAAWPDYTEKEWEVEKWEDEMSLEDYQKAKVERMNEVANLLVTRVVHVGRVIA